MRNKSLNKVIGKGLLICITLLIICLQSAFAQEYNPSLCVYFDNYQKVFLGNFLSRNKKNDDKDTSVKAEFSVKQVLQGIKEPKDKIMTVLRRPKKELIVGETYLVFVWKNKTTQDEFAVTFQANIFIDKSIFAKSNKNKISNESFRVFFGYIPAADREDLNIVKMTISSGKEKQQPKFEAGGIFTIVYQARKDIDVNIQISSTFNIFIPNSSTTNIVNQERKTNVTYRLPDTNCICDYEQFNLEYK